MKSVILKRFNLVVIDFVHSHYLNNKTKVCHLKNLYGMRSWWHFMEEKADHKGEINEVGWHMEVKVDEGMKPHEEN